MAGIINFLIGADPGPFKRGLDQARSAASSFRSDMLKTLGSIAGVAALAGMARSFSEMAGTIADSADTAGLSTESYQKLAGAFSEGNVKSEKFTMAMARLSNVLGEAAQGSATARASLAAIGIDLQQLQSISPEQALYKAADAISSIPDPAERARIAIDLFGKSGAQMIPVLQGGAAALQDAAGKFSAFSDETVRAVDAAGERVDRFALKLKALPVLIADGLKQIEKLEIGNAVVDQANRLMSSSDPTQRDIGRRMARNLLVSAGAGKSAPIARQVVPEEVGPEFGPGNYSGIAEFERSQDRAARDRARETAAAIGVNIAREQRSAASRGGESVPAMQTFAVDQLRRVGGSLSGVNYSNLPNTEAQKQTELQKKMVDHLGTLVNDGVTVKAAETA